MSVAFVFPGQGAQAVGMLSNMGQYGSTIQDRLAAASQIIGIDLSSIVLAGPESKLNQTEITQPAILSVSVGLYELFQEFRGSSPVVMAGHSLGEFSALTAAGAIEFESAISLVYERGRLMQQAVPVGQGQMLAVLGLDDAVIEDICRAVNGVVAPANFNSPGQIVVAGEVEAIKQVAIRCQENGARRVVPIDVSVPSHCPLMESITGQFRALLENVEIHPPIVPIVQNVSAEPTSDAEDIRQNLIAQLSNSVRWHQSVVNMIQSGVTHFIECGPGKVLTGLLRRIDRSVLGSALSNPKDFERASQVG